MRLNKAETRRQAQLLIDEGRVSAAISIYQKIVETDPLDLAAISVLGELYVKAGRLPDAVDHFLRIAENYVRTGSAISAAHILKKVLKLDPANARAHMNIGELYSHEGKTDQAHACFIEAGAAFWHKGNINAAIKMNERALASMPDSRQAKTALALLQSEIDQSAAPQTPKAITGELEPILISIPDEPDSVGGGRVLQGSHLQPEFSPTPVDAVPREGSESSDSLLQGFFDGLSEDAIIEQIAKAEMLVAYGQADQAVVLLRETLQNRPDHIPTREKLKDIYLRCEMNDRASEECLNIAGILAARGETIRARDHVIRARLLSDPDDPIALLAVLQENGVNNAEEVQETSLEWSLDVTQPASVM
jgi:tetratricopeptide (TPR) repeat protein